MSLVHKNSAYNFLPKLSLSYMTRQVVRQAARASSRLAQKKINDFYRSNKKNRVSSAAAVRGSATSSRTKTQTKRRKLFIPAKPIGGHQFVGGYTWARKGKKTPGFAKMDPTIYYSSQDAIIKKDVPGKQVAVHYALMGSKDMDACRSQWGGTQPFSTTRDRKYFIRYCKQLLNISNASNGLVELKVYSIWCRQSLAGAATNYNTPIGMWDQGELDSDSVGGATTPYNNPMQSMKFRKNFKVSRCITRTLNPGEMLKFKTKLFYNKFMSEYDAYQLNEPPVAAEDGSVRGWTHWVLITATGQPCLGRTEGAEDKVTTSEVCLHIVEKKEFQGRYKKDFMEPVVHRANNLPVCLADQGRIISVLTGEEVVMADADQN